MRIFAGGIATETNTFSPIPTTLADFQIQLGRDAAAGRVPYPSLDLSQTWGRSANARGAEFVFSLMAWAEPAGRTTRSAYTVLRKELLEDLRKALPVDIVLLNLHGGMVAEEYPDCEEDLIRQVRALVGPKATIGVEFDLHCHLTTAKIRCADVVLTYKEYPHIDVNDRAQELFELCLAAHRGEVRPTMALFDCRMVGLYPTTRAPLRQIVDDMISAEQRPGVLSISFGHGFPFCDQPDISAKVLVVTDGNPELAQELAAEFGQRIYRAREQIGFEGISLPMDVALGRALVSRTTPVVVADQSDNTGAGGPGDSTYALKWLLDRHVQRAALAILYDPETVLLTAKSAIGDSVAVRLGGKLGRSSGEPVMINAKVLGRSSNYMHAHAQQSGGARLYPLGDVVALGCEGVDVIVASKRCQCFSPAVFADHGIDLGKRSIVVVKSMQHFYNSFSPMAADIVYMSAPGAVPPDPRMIPYTRLNSSALYPWNENPLGLF